MAEHNELGKIGENLASKFLIEKGYSILHKNWCYRKYEIDLIAQLNDTLVFVEVKTRTFGSISSPEDSMTKAKQKRLVEGADAYIKQSESNLEARIDLISVYVKDKKYWVNHIENAVIPRW